MTHSLEDIERRLQSHEPWSAWVSEVRWLIQQVRLAHARSEVMRLQLRKQLEYREVMEGLPRGTLMKDLPE